MLKLEDLLVGKKGNSNKLLHESRMGDAYIEIGETIEELNTVYIKLRGLLDLMRLKSKSPEMRNIKKLDIAIFDLKKIFG